MLKVHVLGDMEVELDGARIPAKPAQRPWALLAMLALSPGPVPRAELAQRFWPDVLDASARASLRSALWTLRRSLGDHLVVDADRAALRDDAYVDAREFERLAAAGQLEGALALCRGELLAGAQDEFALLARERHRERVLELLERLAQAADASGDREQAIAWSREAARRDPLDEGAARRLIARLGAAGDLPAALRAFTTLRDRLARELQVAPAAATRELVESLQRADPQPSQPSGRATTPPLVGRAGELDLLIGAWSTAAAGTGAAAVLTGEAGIGKTRLVAELRARAQRTTGCAFACGAALDLGGSAPLSLWAEIARDLLDALEAPPPPDAAWPEDLTALGCELPARFSRPGRGHPPAVAPDLQRTRLFEAVVSLLSWAARERPLLVVLEDVHVADQPSLELAAYAGRRLGSLPMLLVLTRRQAPASPDADRLEHALRQRGVLSCELSLHPLEPARVMELAHAVAALRPRDADRVAELADGNPLLAVETARALSKPGAATSVAPTLRGVVRATVGALPAQVRGLLEVGAVAGRPIQPDELDALGLPDAVEHAGAALDTGLVVAGERGIGFRHALLRDAAYAEIAEPRRRGLHLRWAQALVACGSAAAEAARHLRLAGRDRDAVTQLALAAGQARSVAALEQAAAFLREALSIDPARGDLQLELGEVESWRARRQQAEEAFAAAQRLAGEDPVELAGVWLARMRAYHGPICAPRQVLEASVQVLDQLDRASEHGHDLVALRHEAIASCAWAHAVAGSIEEAERLLAELDHDTRGDDMRVYDVAHARAFTLMRRSQFRESYGPSIAAGEAAARAGRPDLAYGCWANVAAAASAAGEHERALEFVARAGSLAAQGLQSLEVHMLSIRAAVLTRMARFDEAFAATAAGQELAEQVGDPGLIAMVAHDRGMVALQAGRHADAAELLARALLEDAPASRPQTWIALAEAHVRAGAPEEAEHALREAVLEPVRPSDFPEALVPALTRVQGLLAGARGDHELACGRLQEAVAGWERLVGRAGGVDVASVLADLGRPGVGIIDPSYELGRARADLNRIQEEADALVP